MWENLYILPEIQGMPRWASFVSLPFHRIQGLVHYLPLSSGPRRGGADVDKNWSHLKLPSPRGSSRRRSAVAELDLVHPTNTTTTPSVVVVVLFPSRGLRR